MVSFTDIEFLLILTAIFIASLLLVAFSSRSDD